jgi:hypothetical protein
MNMATVNQTLVRSYTRSVYLYGTYELHDNKGAAVPDVNTAYVPSVMQNARDTLTSAQIENALVCNYITQDEYDATMALTPVAPVAATTEEI